MREVAFTVKVKFCGNCNPRIDSLRVLGEIKLLLPAFRFVTHQEPGDALLILSGCPVNCAERPDFHGPVVTVAGETLDLLDCPAARLPGAAANKIRNLECT